MAIATGRARRPLTVEKLIADVGADSPTARVLTFELDRHLAAMLEARLAPAVDVYARWSALFAPPTPAEARGLFVLHSYWALIVEALAAALGAGSPAGDALAWWRTDAPPEIADAEGALRARLRGYRIAALDEGRDLLRVLYHELVPPTLRKRLGEFYTPEWLVDLVLDEVGFCGERLLAEPRLLDPCCGSGSFLIRAIERVKRAALAAGETDAEAADRALRAVAGVDLNPFAALAARVGCLMALAELVPDLAGVSPPVHAGDAITGSLEPGAPPLGTFDAVVGNPPWVRWSDLPAGYREAVKPACDRLGIYARARFFGGSELDVSGVIAYAATERWLAPGGALGFVITQTHFQAPASEGFRRFALADGTPLRLLRVHDLSSVRPFAGLANKTAVFTWRRGEPTEFPVDYVRWEPVGRVRSLPEGDDLAAVRQHVELRHQQATALAPDRRFCILPRRHATLARRLAGPSDAWRGRKGITTDMNAVYFVDVLGEGAAPGLVRVRTRPAGGRRPVPELEADVEQALLHPLLKGGGQIRAFAARPSDAVAAIVPNRRITGMRSERAFAERFPAAHAYFDQLRGLLRTRSTWRTRLAPSGAPFWAIYNVGPYTFSPFKVVWAEIARGIAAAVVAGWPSVPGAPDRAVVADHKVYFVATDEPEAAHFLCALLNAEPVRAFIDGFTVKLQTGSVLRHVRLPAYDPANPQHRELAELSRRAHAGEPPGERLDALAWGLVRAGA